MLWFCPAFCSTDKSIMKFSQYLFIDKTKYFCSLSLSLARQPNTGQDRLILDVSRPHTTVSRTSLDEWSARPRDLYLTTHNTHKRQTSMPPAEFEFAIPANYRPLTLALDCSATEIGKPASDLFYSWHWVNLRQRLPCENKLHKLRSHNHQVPLSFLELLC